MGKLVTRESVEELHVLAEWSRGITHGKLDVPRAHFIAHDECHVTRTRRKLRQRRIMRNH